MNGGFLLDTSVVIGILRHDFSVVNRFPSAMRLFLPCIVLGELFYGARHSGRMQHNLDRLVELSKSFPILPCDAETAELYGKLKAGLRKKGRPLPDNDIWIAAVAEQKQLTILTRDAHFKEFGLLAVEIW